MMKKWLVRIEFEDTETKCNEYTILEIEASHPLSQRAGEGLRRHLSPSDTERIQRMIFVRAVENTEQVTPEEQFALSNNVGTLFEGTTYGAN